jgi:acyl-CoA reductase-like NAD-dependent aldehyde dehydrogenase
MATNGTNLVVPLQIDGKEKHSSLPAHPVYDPSTTKPCWHFSPASHEDALAAVDAADAARAWANSKPAVRRAILLKTADIIEAHADEYGRWMELETGATPSFSAGFNLPMCVNILRDVAGRLIGALNGMVPTCSEPNRYAMVLKEPYGVVLSIAPW